MPTEADSTLYRRALPSDAIPFSSSEGRLLFGEALSAGELDGYFPLAEQFHTQSDPAFCGLGSLVMALNALAIDPGRLWKGPWRWFGEELLDCCVPLPVVRERGVSMDELACLARCNGAEVTTIRADGTDLDSFRSALSSDTRPGSVMIASYDRKSVGQTGSGHFSPIGGYHRARDLVLVLDVARFKYPPHWIPAARLFAAMRPLDPSTGRARGWLVVRPRAGALGLGFTVRCEGDGWQGWADRLARAAIACGPGATVSDLALALLPHSQSIDVRAPVLASARASFEHVRAALHGTDLYAQVAAAVGEASAEVVAVLVLASEDLLLPAQRATVAASVASLDDDAALRSELASVRAQVAALREAGIV
jgi:glutathione gamma-glutamylcysteinyltransferase